MRKLQAIQLSSGEWTTTYRIIGYDDFEEADCL